MNLKNVRKEYLAVATVVIALIVTLFLLRIFAPDLFVRGSFGPDWHTEVTPEQLNQAVCHNMCASRCMEDIAVDNTSWSEFSKTLNGKTINCGDVLEGACDCQSP